MKKLSIMFFLISLSLSTSVLATGNENVDTFSSAKKYLNSVYEEFPETFYCKAKFFESKDIFRPDGFNSMKYVKRSIQIEWEHIVPAENLGQSFDEWNIGDPRCYDKKGRKFKGRKCAEKVNKNYRLMQADMYNLVPSIGSVNATRSNFDFFESNYNDRNFGSCPMTVTGKRVEPGFYSKGAIARTYKYVSKIYPASDSSDKKEKTGNAWSKLYPVDEWECRRVSKISQIQSNENGDMSDLCSDLGFEI